MLITKADLFAIERELAQRSLAEFVKQAWHIVEPATPLAWGWVLDCITEHLEAVTSGDIKRLLANVPPGTMKSLLTNVFWPAWEWGPKGLAWTRHLHTAHKQELAVRDTIKCRRLIQSDWFQRRWPTELTGDQNAKTKFENKATGFIEAMAFTSMTGARGDRVHLDDPHSVDDANSPVKLASAITTFREALPSRINNDNSAIVIIMQRLNVGDVSAVALELGYDHLCVPMRYEYGRSAFVLPKWSDPRTQDGELMFPERFNEERVQELEKSLGSFASAGQLQQRPTPRGGGILKPAWFGEYDPANIPPLEWRSIYADTAQKTGQEHDYSVVQCWGRTVSGQAILLDQIRGKWEAPELLHNIREFWLKHKAAHAHGSELRSLKVEDKASGIGLIQTLRREGVPVVAIPRNKDKITRAHDAAPFMESGNVLLPQWSVWLEDFVKEVESFGAGGVHDDQVDPMIDAIMDVQAVPTVNPAAQAFTPIPMANRW